MNTLTKFFLEDVRLKVSQFLARAAKWFVPEAKLTFTMRVPGNDDCFLIVTDDDLTELIRVIELELKRVNDLNRTPRATLPAGSAAEAAPGG